MTTSTVANFTANISATIGAGQLPSLMGFWMFGFLNWDLTVKKVPLLGGSQFGHVTDTCLTIVGKNSSFYQQNVDTNCSHQQKKSFQHTPGLDRSIVINQKEMQLLKCLFTLVAVSTARLMTGPPRSGDDVLCFHSGRALAISGRPCIFRSSDKGKKSTARPKSEHADQLLRQLTLYLRPRNECNATHLTPFWHKLATCGECVVAANRMDTREDTEVLSYISTVSSCWKSAETVFSNVSSAWPTSLPTAGLVVVGAVFWLST